MNQRNTDAASIDWTLGFRARAYRQRIPIAATLELTSRCNLRCQHCYLGDQDAQHARSHEERTAEEVKASLREWAEAGCLYLLITGGDPMMRKDFQEVYRIACELGMVVTVFCNGVLVTDEIIQLFKEMPPRKVEVSIYGATAETYERVTQVAGSYAKAWAGIDRLCENGIRVVLKTILMTLNEHELNEMEAQALERNLSFRFDAAVCPCISDHSRAPLDLRVDPDVVIRHDLATPERRKQWAEAVERARNTPKDDRLYGCSAGATGFYADPFGNLAPCVMTGHYQVEQNGRPFKAVWENELGEIQKKKKTRDDGCFSGELRGVCTHCPAANYLETGDEEKDSDYMAKTVRLRHVSVKGLMENEINHE